MERHKEPFRETFSLILGAPFASRMVVGRNSVMAVDAETGEVSGWGSNKHGQLVPGDAMRGLFPITDLHFQLNEGEKLIPSSYVTLMVTKRDVSSLFRTFEQESSENTS